MTRNPRIQTVGASSTRFPRRELIVAVLLAVITAVVLFTQPFSARAAGGAGDLSAGVQTQVAGEQLSDADNSIPTQDLWSIIRKGGPVMIPIGICSFLLLTFVFERIVSLRRRRIIPRPFVTRFIEQLDNGELDRAKALTLCEENGSPVSEVFAAAVRKWGRPEVEVEQAIIDAGERITNGLRRNLRVLNGLATVSPLLGIMGTVTGMIRAFNVIATSDALGRPELLAAGISEALLTTAAGLCVAIPALICYMYFVSRVDKLIIEIDSLGQQIVIQVSAEAASKSKSRRETKRPAA